MRFPARPNPMKEKTSQSDSFPVPIMGLNAYDDIANMAPQFARTMINVFPNNNTVSVRPGYTEHATTMTNAVQSLIPWGGNDGTVKIIATTSDTIYNATTSGTAATVLGTSQTNGKWQHVEMTTSGGHYTLFCNGADNIKQYDGSSVTEPSYSGTGFTSANMINTTSHKSRVWFIEKDSTDVWYLGTNAISGAASKFPLGGVFKLGGYTMAAGTHSVDAGDSLDDYMVFISNKGEILIYAGTDPSSANTWSLKSRAYTAPPLGRRCLANLNGDLVILTERGVMSLNALMRFDQGSQDLASVSNKIDPLIIDAAGLYGSNGGWQLETYKKKNWLIVNVPVSEDASYKQYVMNTLTGAWCEFNDINSVSWLSTQDAIYFGGVSGSTWQADNGYQDNGGQITAKIRTAWNYLNLRGSEKHVTMIRPVTTSQGTPGIRVKVNSDFLDADPSGSIAVTSSSAATWGSATWDGSVWGGTVNVTQKWTSATAVGMCHSVACDISINGGECNLHSFDLVGHAGGTL